MKQEVFKQLDDLAYTIFQGREEAKKRKRIKKEIKRDDEKIEPQQRVYRLYSK